MPSKQIKYKLQDVAKDLNIDKSELIELLDKAFPSDTQRKGQSSLTSDEVGYVLEKYTRKNEVDNITAAFATTKDIKTEKPAEPEKKPAKKKPAAKKSEEEPEAKAEKTEKPKKIEKPAKAEVKAEPVKAEKKREPEVKAEEKPEIKAEKKPEPEKKPEVKAEPKPEQKKQDNAPKQGARPESRDNRSGKDGKPRDNRDSKDSRDNKPRDNRENRDNRQRDNGAAPRKPQQKPAAAKAVIDSSKIKVNTPPMQKQKGETVQRGEQVRKTVDTRGSYVELDKYNERYETIAPAGKMNNDSFRSKQKINQKSQQRGKQQYGKQRETEAQKLRRLELERARKQQLKVQIPDEIVVGELATRLKVTATEVIKKLFNLGVMANINEMIDFDTASIVAEELGAKVEKEVIITIEERLFEDAEDAPESLKPRSPVVVVMGHVDHGKTSILDYIRHANVQSGEAGGITQHIGAYRVHLSDRDITFLDTPGHEAFTSMRARGAMITDIAILVVAADDGIMPQTIEAINHAKAAGVQIIVAMNKMDKEGANPEKVKEELTKYDLVCEDWGGNVICVPVSAKTGLGMDTLLEMVGLTADVMELKANPDRLARGAVIEARLDKSRGPIATLLVQNGTLHTGDILIAGTSVGRVRVMRDDKGKTVTEAGPSVPVEIMGLSEVPSAGDTFAAVEDEKLARELVEKRKHEAKEEQFKSYQKVTLDNLFSSIEQGEVKELPIIVKGDVQGSVEAVKQSLEKLTNEEVRVRVIHGAVGAVSESDVMLAMASGAIIVGFNVRPHPSAEESAKENGVEVRLYRVIYDAIEDITAAMKGMLAPKFREVQLGRVEVRQVFKITGVGIVAGSYVLDGKVARSGQVRIVRDGIIVGDDHIAGLQRFKDSVKEVAAGYECGISLEKFTDIKEGDVFEAYVMEEYQE
ncbi:MAG: translation initiation factor IF-2 [Lachnospiraceae bacterium]|nr:translation initiation factor IF-2 [Ruminococcus sp.]MCM1275326.1 translation initiation factor IF-2 [Lachnospiraceae bacterium]